MKMKLIVGLFTLITTSVFAAPGQDFKGLSCESFDGSHRIEAQLQECQDSRYTEWNEDGCYHIKVIDRGEAVFDQEILRDVTWRETQQGYYTLYSYDQDEWITIGMILKVQPENNGKYLFRFDQRGSRREEMVIRTKGSCSLNL